MNETTRWCDDCGAPEEHGPRACIRSLRDQLREERIRLEAVEKEAVEWATRAAIACEHRDAMNTTAQRISGNLRAAMEVLRAVEFGDETDFGDYCPVSGCGGMAPQDRHPGKPHSPGCKLAAVLAGEPRCSVCGGLPLPGCDGLHLCPAP